MSSDNNDFGSDREFRAWRIHDDAGDGIVAGKEETCTIGTLRVKGELPNHAIDYNEMGHGDILMNVTHASLNHKDHRIASGKKRGTIFPHTPGIDAAGYHVVGTGVHQTAGSALVSGYDLGVKTDGGFGEIVRVPSEWVIRPNPFDAVGTTMDEASHRSMVYGTEGLAAAWCVSELVDDPAISVWPKDGSVLVTVSPQTWGVASIAIEILAGLGFSVVAALASQKDGDGGISYSSMSRDMLLDLGASEVVLHNHWSAPAAIAATAALYAHAIDVAGVGVPRLFLKGIRVKPKDPSELPLEEKRRLFTKLANEWRCPVTEGNARSIGRHELEQNLGSMEKEGSRIVLDHERKPETVEKGWASFDD